MTPWIALALGAQFLAAITVLIDKHILARAAHIGKPIVYAFYVSFLSGFVIVLVPFGVIHFPSFMVVLLSTIGAATFTGSIFLLYSALTHARASDVAPVVGGVSAIVSLILAALFIAGDTHAGIVPSVLILALGTVLISHFHFTRDALYYTLGAGLLFGITIVLNKGVYLQTDFFDGFFWTRMLNVVCALALLISPVARRSIFHAQKHASQGAKALVVGNKVIAGVASVMTAFAVSIGSVSFVNALAGVQFVFLLLFSFLFARFMPKTPSIAPHGGWQTALGVGCICVGLALPYVL